MKAEEHSVNFWLLACMIWAAPVLLSKWSAWANLTLSACCLLLGLWAAVKILRRK